MKLNQPTHILSEDSVMIEVHAASIIPIDNIVKIGDEVFSRPNQMDSGSIAEFNVVKEEEFALKPSKLSHEEAASMPLARLTALQAITTKGKHTKDQKVLIHPGSGGVGTFAIQIAKHLGAEVAVTTSTSNFELVKNLGADIVIDYKTQKFENRHLVPGTFIA